MLVRAVPELTRSPGIKLNARVSLRRHQRALSPPHRTISPCPGPHRQSRQAIILRLAALFSTAAVCSSTVSVLIFTCLDARPRAVASQTTGCRAVGAHVAITLRDNDLPILDSQTTGVCICQRRAGHEEQHAESQDTFHREPPALLVRC
jgi:hypothetical protein